MHAKFKSRSKVMPIFVMMMMMMMMMIFVVWLTDEKRLALFPAGTTVRNLHYCESPKFRKQDLNLRRTWVQVSWMNLCSSDNRYTMAPSLWRHLWQTAANFLYNNSLNRNTRFLISGQVSIQSLWKFVHMESTCFKTLKLQYSCKMLGESCEARSPFWRHFPKLFKTVSK